jgi:AcrR family transcriptional regulator
MDTESLSKGERTRQAIQDAAYHLFLEQGYSASSMRQIAEAAGLAVSGIYNHFASKDEIFEAIVHDKHPYKQILPVLIAAPGVTTEAFVRNAAQALVDELGRRPDFLKLMFIEIVEFNTEHLPGIFEEILPQVLPLIQRLQSPANSIRSIHPALVLRAFLGMFFSFYMTEAMLGETMPTELREHGFESFVDIFLHGILLPVAEE